MNKRRNISRINAIILTGFLLNLFLGVACKFPIQTALPPTPTQQLSPSPTLGTPTLSPTVLPSATPGETQETVTASPTISEITSPCEGQLLIKLLAPPERTKDLFEHHAKGVFLIFYLEIINQTSQDIQIFSSDYTLLIPQGNGKLELAPHKAATNYLYIVRGGSFYQDKIKPNTAWRTYLAFDIEPQVTEWQLILSPGNGSGTPICTSYIMP